MSVKILRHGIFQLGNKERPRCPECDSTNIDIEPFNMDEFLNIFNSADVLIVSCGTCGCVWQISVGDVPVTKMESTSKKDETKRH